MTVSVADELAAHPFLVDLPDRVVHALAPLAAWLEVDARQVLGREGDPAGRFYLLPDEPVARQAAAPPTAR
jgi:hypothetical protein